jgi:hypothetical protein
MAALAALPLEGAVASISPSLDRQVWHAQKVITNFIEVCVRGGSHFGSGMANVATNEPN